MQKRRCSMDLLHRAVNRHGFGIADPAQPVRLALQGRQAERGGDTPQGFPLECKRERAAPKARRGLHSRRSRKKRVARRTTRLLGHTMTCPASRASRA
ncbi:hypothetical protein EJP80_05655 [Rahnella aquatilis]|nr:hypothetical protein EJP80_05655 [Rahnella aquatilis]